ncbi:hypothetical protein BC827DRAFT_645477 [Russula dissimulans]|nr:hypothetical protein BC827DRAFT_645477 [Russula dissimulans]
MSDASTSATQQQTAGTTATSRSTNKNNVAIIIVACLGGFLFIVALLLVLVPYVRRQAARRQANKSKASTSSGSNSTTTVHNRTVSADASVPLLEPDPNTSTEYSRFRSTTAQSNVETLPSAPHTPGAYSLNPLPRRFAPTFKPSLPPLRHARTRIARVPMDTLPEDAPTDISTQRGPSPTTSDDSHAPAPTSWLHIPKAQGMPLIGAFRGSISSLASGASSSLPTMQHYPSISQNLKSASASASTRSSQTFYTVASDGPTASHDAGPPPSEHGELLQSAAPAWLKPSGVGKRTPQPKIFNDVRTAVGRARSAAERHGGERFVAISLHRCQIAAGFWRGREMEW